MQQHLGGNKGTFLTLAGDGGTCRLDWYLQKCLLCMKQLVMANVRNRTVDAICGTLHPFLC